MRTPSRRGTTGALATACALVAPFYSGVMATPVYAQQSTSAEGGTVSLDIRDARLEEAVVALTANSGIKNIVFQNPENKSFGTVTVTLHDQPIERVLRSVASSAGAAMWIEDGIYYVGSRGTSESKPTPAPAPTQEIPAAPARRSKSILVKIPLTYMRPSDMRRALLDPNFADALSQDDPAFMPNQLAPGQNRFPSPTILDSTIKLQLDGNSGVHVEPNSNAPVRGQGTGGFSAGRDEGTLSSAGQVGIGGFQGGNFQGGNQAGRGGQGQGQGTLRPQDITAIIANDSSNDLIVKSDTPEGIDELRTIIRLLDVAPKQVQVKAEFVSVSVNDADSFGIDWRITPSGNLDAFAPALGNASSLTVAYASGNAVANLRATLLKQTTNLIQSPIISTLNNRQGSVQFSDSLPIFNSTVVLQGNGNAVTSNNQTQAVATNGINVTPHINGDGSITMFLTPVLQSNQQVSGPNGQTGVRQTTQQVTAYRRIQSGETMVIGGFITRQEVRSTNEVPFLGSLPIIGALFRSRDRTVTGSEVLVFVTPTIIEDRSQGTTGGSGSAAPTP